MCEQHSTDEEKPNNSLLQVASRRAIVQMVSQTIRVEIHFESELRHRRLNIFSLDGIANAFISPHIARIFVSSPTINLWQL